MSFACLMLLLLFYISTNVIKAKILYNNISSQSKEAPNSVPLKTMVMYRHTSFITSFKTMSKNLSGDWGFVSFMSIYLLWNIVKSTFHCSQHNFIAANTRLRQILIILTIKMTENNLSSILHFSHARSSSHQNSPEY